MRLLLVSLQFLTILPLPFKFSEEELGSSMLFFPLVGFLIGGLLAGVCWIGTKFLPSPVVVALLIILWIFITGALHLDGLADTLDGLYAGKSKEERLKIMRDEYIGVMGITGIVTILLFKYTLLSSLTTTHIFKTLILTPALSRWGMVVSASISPYAREEGKGKVFVERVRWWYAPLQGVILLAVSVWFFNLINGLWLIAGLLTLLWLSTLLFQRRIGGVSGDTLGAVNEIGELLPLILILLFRME